MAQAILGSLQTKTPEEEQAAREAEALRYAQLTPEQQDAFTYRVNQGYINEGVKSAVGGALGVDVRSASAKRRDAIERVKAQVAARGIDPENLDTFYVAVIKALGAEGLVAEAAEVAREYQEQKRARQKGELETRKLELSTAREQRMAEQASRRLDLDEAKLNLIGPKAAQLVGQMNRIGDQMRNLSVDDPRYAMLNTSFENLKRALDAELATKNFELKSAGDRFVLFNKATGKVEETGVGIAETATQKAKREAKEGNRASAYNELMAGLQDRYDAVIALHNHPGVEGITGRLGRYVGQKNAEGAETWGSALATGVSSDAARAAVALFERVQGGAFLAGLNTLKAASKTGATGLGAVSEREGDKVQSDAANINRAQEAADFRQALADYARRLEASAQRIAADAQGYGVTAPALQPGQLSAPARGGRRPSAPPVTPPARPAAQPAAPAAGGWSAKRL